MQKELNEYQDWCHVCGSGVRVEDGGLFNELTYARDKRAYCSQECCRTDYMADIIESNLSAIWEQMRKRNFHQ